MDKLAHLTPADRAVIEATAQACHRAAEAAIAREGSFALDYTWNFASQAFRYACEAAGVDPEDIKGDMEP